MTTFVVEPYPGKQARCQAIFHGANGQCTRQAAWSVITDQGEVADLCEICTQPYLKISGEVGPPPEPDWDAA